MTSNLLYGLVYGQALGDAVGYYTEFSDQKQLKNAYPTRDSFVFPPIKLSLSQSKRTSACDWTDDTDHLILLMEMLTENNNQVSIPAFTKKIKHWVQSGFPELGDTTGEGCGRLLYLVVNRDNFITNPFSASKDVWRGDNAPNGSIMRTAIMAIRHLPYQTTIEDAVQLSQTTHYDPRCSVAVAVLTSILWHIIYYPSAPEEKVLDKLDHICEKYGGEEYCSDAKSWCRKRSLDDMDLNNEIGYSLKCMGVAVWAYRNRERDFKDMILEIILKGGDADTNAAVAGSILGTYKGYNALPREWLNKLPNKGWLDKKCNSYIKVLKK